MFLLYSALSVLIHFLAAPYFFFWPPARRKYMATLAERFSIKLPSPTPAGQPCIWIHTVSVGELLAVAQLIDRLQQRLPHCRMLVSTITVAGNALARKRYPKLDVIYFPLDWSLVIHRLLRRIHPTIFLSVESEIWPNFYRLAHASGCRLLIVNGRITAKACRNYLRARFLFKKVLSFVDLCLMQNEEYARRILQIGAAKERVVITGNLKFDLELQETESVSKLLALIRAALVRNPGDPILVAGSTMPGEEEQVLELYRSAQIHHPECRLILAPRHPQRFDDVAQWLSERGHQALRRSRLGLAGSERPATGNMGSSETGTEALPEATGERDILLLDSIGELAFVYQLATVAFVGGSLVPHGGHNILEPAYYGKAIVVGPSMDNFKDIARSFFEGGGVLQASGLPEMKEMVKRLLDDEKMRKEMGRQASRIMSENKGALECTMARVIRLMGEPS